ncbi:uncharacterized protein UHOD_12214 [Ustilago sp. UG-2017b]|nr:uncharacterized protein UHOD_12214 [Ustilago sp. UG-2017b]
MVVMSTNLLRRLARAPGFIAPPTPSEDSIAMPPPTARPGRTSTASSTADASTSRNTRGARDSAASSPPAQQCSFLVNPFLAISHATLTFLIRSTTTMIH